MKAILTAADIPALVSWMGERMTAAKQPLGKLDSLTGDGDMGVTVVLCFKAMGRAAKRIDGMALSEIFELFGEEVGEFAPSTFGTFVSTMLGGMVKPLEGAEEIDGSRFAACLRAAAEAVMVRGGAKPGDKTLLDALVPAADAAGACADAGGDVAACARATAQAAREGAEATPAMKAVTGRAGYMGERTIGSKDPGAEAIALLSEAFCGFAEA